MEGETGAVRVEARHTAPRERHHRDLWIVTLDREGRCTAFEEWADATR